MGLYNYSDGVLTPIAGRGKAEYGASTIRKGTYSFANASAAGWRYATVTFDTPMVDTDYEIILTPSVGTTSAQSMSTAYTIDNKTINGFRISYYDTTATSNVSGNYTAFKLYTDNEYNGLLNNQRYSTDEIDTGKTWIDGKTIYRKVITGLSIILDGNTWSNIVDISSLNMDICIECVIFNNTNKLQGHPSTKIVNGYLQGYLYGWANTAIHTVILEYTKTT